MLGKFDEARSTFAKGIALLEEIGNELGVAMSRGNLGGEIEALAGNNAAAADHLQYGCRYLDEIGARGLESTWQGHLALHLAALGRMEEAGEAALKAEAYGAADDWVTQILWRRGKARVCAGNGELQDARRYIGDAADIAQRIQNPQIQGDTLLDYADVLLEIGELNQAAGHCREAIVCYERKGCIASTTRAREKLSLIEAAG
jgi:tetratricopeptide (TPR) repeat protein